MSKATTDHKTLFLRLRELTPVTLPKSNFPDCFLPSWDSCGLQWYEDSSRPDIVALLLLLPASYHGASETEDAFSRHGQLLITLRWFSCRSISKLWLSMTRFLALRTLLSQRFTELKVFIQYVPNPYHVPSFFVFSHTFYIILSLYGCALTLYKLMDR